MIGADLVSCRGCGGEISVIYKGPHPHPYNADGSTHYWACPAVRPRIRAKQEPLEIGQRLWGPPTDLGAMQSAPSPKTQLALFGENP